MKSVGSLLPEHEGLRRAVQWLAAQKSWDAKLIEEASCRFDLSPIDEEFLLRNFRDAGHGNEDGRQPETGDSFRGSKSTIEKPANG